MKSRLTHLECSRCGATSEPDRIAQLCDACGSPLLARYDLRGVDRSALGGRRPDLWRYRELLPVRNDENIVTLGEGMTPIIRLKDYLLKDDGVIPTGTFKARGAAVGVSRARELGVRTLAMPTNGNAGSAWALYAARAGIRPVIVMPTGAPAICRAEIAAAGADLYLVNGLISDAGKIVARAIARHGWYDASTLKEPYRIEGKKTMGYEIAEQLDWQPPDVILYPTGGGVGLIGIHKAMQEMRELGWIDGELPRMVAVQATGCAPIVRAFEKGRQESEYFEDSRTVAFGINVPKALGDFLVLRAIAESGGCAIAVSDQEILDAQRRLARDEGLFICPEGAATFAAAERLRASGWIREGERVLLLNTGAGIKYPETVPTSPPVLEPTDELPL